MIFYFIFNSMSSPQNRVIGFMCISSNSFYLNLYYHVICNVIKNKGIMKIQDVNHLNSLVGKEVECCVTGLMVQGVVTEVREDQWSYTVTVDHSAQPVQWGEANLKFAHIFQRKSDGWGSVKYLKVL